MCVCVNREKRNIISIKINYLHRVQLYFILLSNSVVKILFDH